MAETPSANPEAFKLEDATSYDPVASEFDVFVDLLSPPLVEKLISLARVKSTDAVLDIGTGTGNGIVALEAAQHAKAGRVVGIDLAEQMIIRSRERVASRGVENTAFQVMDAENLAFSDTEFDKVVSLFALLHFPHPERALKEMRRVLKPGGTLVLAIGSSSPLLSVNGLKHRMSMLVSYALYKMGRVLIAPFFLDSLVEKHSEATSSREQSDLAAQGLDRRSDAIKLVREAGFDDVQWAYDGHTASISKAEEYWDLQRTFSSFSRKRINRMNAQQVEAVKQEFSDRCRKVIAQGGSLLYPYGAFYIIGQRT